jgi:hypothetical protein
MNIPETFDLARFEQRVLRGEHEAAARDLLAMLASIEQHYGRLGEVGEGAPGDARAAEATQRIVARLASAIGQLFANPAFVVTELGFMKFLILHRWIAMIFAASPFDNADHVIGLLANHATDGSGELNFSGNNLLKLTLLYGLESDIPIQPEALWIGNPAVALSIGVAMLSSRICISPRAAAKRDVLLGWLPERLGDVQMSDANLQALDDAYMHCSYSTLADKHAVKTALNRQARQRMMRSGCDDVTAGPPQRARPVMVVACEWMHSRSAMYRCYAPSIEALRDKFELHALVREDCIDDVGRALFDHVAVVSWNDGPLPAAAAAIAHLNALRPDVVFYPSVGMSTLNVILSTFRLAPLQFMCLGHPATSRSPAIDYVAVEEGYLGDPDCFSERLLVVPNQSQPWVPPHESVRLPHDIRAEPSTVRIAVTASTMKLNPEFLAVCRDILERSSVPVEFRFFCGGAVGLARVYVEKCVQRFLPGALVYGPVEYNAYIAKLNECDLFLSPFPFGNTNGIVDAVRQGIPGVCLDGREVHAHIDAELFRRLSLPGWLVAASREDYLAAALRLAGEHKTRQRIANHLVKIDPDAILFKGDPRQFANAVAWLHANQSELQHSGEKVVRAPLPKKSRRS